MILGQPIHLLSDRFSDIDEEHLNLQRRPVQSVPEGSPGDAVETPQNDVSQNMAAFLKLRSLCPRANRTLEALNADVVETGLCKLTLGLQNSVEIGSQSSHSIFQIVEKITPSVRTITRIIITSSSIVKLLKFEPGARLKMT